MIAAARSGSWTPGSWTTIWSGSCLRTSGSETPSLSMRARTRSTAIVRPSCVTLWPFGASAFITISSWPWRSRPSVVFLCSGDPGTATSTTPTSAATIRPIRIRWLRRACTGYRPRLARLLLEWVGRGRQLIGRLPPPPGLPELVELVLVGREDRGDRAARDAHVRPRRDLEREPIVLDGAHRSVEAAGGQDLVPRGDVLELLLLLELATLLRPDHEEPEQREDRDDHE